MCLSITYFINLLTLCLVNLVTGDVANQNTLAYKYTNDNYGTYMILAPRRFRANMIYRMSVVLLKRHYVPLHIYTSIRNVDRGEEISSATLELENEGERTLELQIPKYVLAGNYSLRVEGKYDAGSGGSIFWNETALLFNTKQISVFIETDKITYNRKGTLRFRVIPVKPNLMPVAVSMDIFIKQDAGVIVKRWLGQAVVNGRIEKELKLHSPLRDRPWTIEVHAYGHVFTKKFNVKRVYPKRMLVNVTMPPYAKDTDFGIAGSIYGVYFPSWLPMKGNGTISITIGGDKDRPLIKDIPYFDRQHQFLITMEELRAHKGIFNLGGTVLKCTVRVYDYQA